MSATFQRHPWPYASAFSLVGCYARINVLDRRDLLSQWLLPKRRGRVEQHLYWQSMPNIVGVGMLCRTFDLAPGAIPLAFDLATWWPFSLRLAQTRTKSCLRFCPECLYQGYHTGLFQLPWWNICPIHWERLLERCPKCASPISRSRGLNREEDPGRLFHCPTCSFDLANTAAIVAASHQSVSDDLHQLVAAHRQWSQQVDSRFVVPPVFGSEYWSLKRDEMLALLSLAQVPLPITLRSFAEAPSQANTFPLKIKVKCGEPVDPNVASHLVSRLFWAAEESPRSGNRELALDWHQAKRLLAVERRLQRSFCRPIARAHWDCHYKSRVRTVRDRPICRAMKREIRTWEEGFLERGYRRRMYEMAVFSDLSGDSTLKIKDSELQRLTAVRLLLGLAAFLETAQSQEPEQRPIRQVAEWWHDHFLVLALIDATIHATHANSYIDHGGSDPYLQRSWPMIGLDRISPGHDWSISAVRKPDAKAGVLEAHIMSWPFGPLVDPERWRCRETWDRRERFARDLQLTVDVMRGLGSRRIYGEF